MAGDDDGQAHLDRGWQTLTANGPRASAVGLRPVMIEPVQDGIVLAVRVITRAGRPGLAGTRDDAVLVRLGAAPVDGAANAELVAVLATAFGVARRAVVIVAGERSRLKRVRLDGVDAATALAIVAAAPR